MRRSLGKDMVVAVVGEGEGWCVCVLYVCMCRCVWVCGGFDRGFVGVEGGWL